MQPTRKTAVRLRLGTLGPTVDAHIVGPETAGACAEFVTHSEEFTQLR
jgi:hypothetical protein